jgi:predicted ester cyclase
MNIHNQNKNIIQVFRAALYDLEPTNLKQQLSSVFAPDAKIQLAFPFENVTGPDALFESVYAPLIAAIPDLERRDYIVMAGAGDSSGLPGNWVGCAGFYTGVFDKPWLDIPPTRHPVTMRYHEFFRVENNKVVEMQSLRDIPEVMMQARAWPMTPGLGVEWLVPGPATPDGIITTHYDAAQSEQSRNLVHNMLNGLQRHAEHGVEAMGLKDYWHPKMVWYGPAGIGTMRQIAGFRRHHQIPFLNALPDREVTHGNGVLFADGDYVGFTGWPGMKMTISGDGWLGIAPSNQEITMRSLDFWRCEAGMIRENWVLIDLLHVYNQIGVDVFSRMREVTYGRQKQ